MEYQEDEGSVSCSDSGIIIISMTKISLLYDCEPS